MKSKSIQKYPTWCFVLPLALFFLTSPSLHAEMYSYDFTGDFDVWDLSGSYSDAFMGCSMDFIITQDSKGKIIGFGTASCSLSGIDIDMSFDIKGSVKQKNNVVTLKMSMKFKGTVGYLGETYKFKGREKITAVIDPFTAVMNGIVKLCISIRGLGSMCDTAAFSLAVTPGMDGSSNIVINVNPVGKKLGGAGTFTLSNGDDYNFVVTGKSNPKKNQTKLKLKGYGPSKGCGFSITVDESDDSIISLKGKLLGQKLQIKN